MFFDSIIDFLYVLDLQGNMLRINNTVLERLGYTPDELTGKSVLMVHPSEPRDEALRIVHEMIAGKSILPHTCYDKNQSANPG